MKTGLILVGLLLCACRTRTPEEIRRDQDQERAYRQEYEARRQRELQEEKREAEREAAREAVKIPHVGSTRQAVSDAWGDPCEKTKESTTDGELETWVFCRLCPNKAAMWNALSHSRMETTCTARKEVIFRGETAAAVRVTED